MLPNIKIEEFTNLAMSTIEKVGVISQVDSWRTNGGRRG